MSMGGKKDIVISGTLATRRAIICLAHSMSKPIVGPLTPPHPCLGCGHKGSANECETIVHNVEGDMRIGCWHPEGTLPIGDEV